MNEQTEMTTRQEDGALRAPTERELILRPAVDIFEDANAIVVEADMPGVAKDRLDIQVDRNSLTLEGEVAITMPEGMRALYADVRGTRYRRNFSLSSELDTEQVEANLKDGLLRVRIPKRAELQPRKIEVKTD
ncbi:Hsp20/alpha crystallin family protein [Halochromatium glycolicum]|jgi:HSP20 family molecular chaperone IbpA|uniref:Heat-shock protein n=1 Tax=Halochromatium glycolicum TaxID=85075 RepID=A0AAJ0X9L7_9GAMM|nr:Hsp20/alpha crystallin family protein [Halochromatium glycolicum]MBK1704944.1 heat-shock protein [Halochromatium glycolicum]